MILPKFLLGHNALLGIRHLSEEEGSPKFHLTAADRDFLRLAVDLGLKGMVLDSNQIAVAAARFLRTEFPEVVIAPMIPYAQAIVEASARGGIPKLAIMALPRGLTTNALNPKRITRCLFSSDITGATAAAALSYFAGGLPVRASPILFIHNVVTDLLLGWRAWDMLRGLADACRDLGSSPGFVTLNVGRIPTLSDVVGKDAWFMCAVNSRGIQMSPSREASEKVLLNPSYNVIAMSVLAGGAIPPSQGIAQAFGFPSVKSVVIGTRNLQHLEELLRLVEDSCEMGL